MVEAVFTSEDLARRGRFKGGSIPGPACWFLSPLELSEHQPFPQDQESHAPRPRKELPPSRIARVSLG